MTDENSPLDPAFGSRRRPGDTVSGELTPRARQQIRRSNLWDSHVRATIELHRRRKGRGVRIEGMRMLKVEARFRDGPDSE